MTLDEAIIILRQMIPDFTSLVHSDTDLRELLRQGADEVAALTLCYERQATLTSDDLDPVFALGQREYPLRDSVNAGGLGLGDALKVLHVHIDGFPLTQITPASYTAARLAGTPTGRPEFWYEFAGHLGFRPTPSQAWLDDYTMEINYAAEVEVWTEGECPLPPAFDDLILQFAYLKAMIREGQWEEALSTFTGWLEEVAAQRLVSQRPATQQSGPPMPPTQARDQRRQRR